MMHHPLLLLPRLLPYSAAAAAVAVFCHPLLELPRQRLAE
jgi:hypothetical protein